MAAMESTLTHDELRAALEWQIELGATEAAGDGPINWYDLNEAPAAQSAKTTPQKPASATPTPVAKVAEIDPVAEARKAAAKSDTLEKLHQSLFEFDFCELKKGARNTVFADGLAGAEVMIIGEAPGRDEDIEGRPFVGRAGQLLDKMLAAIALDRTATTPDAAVYITNVMPWRPPQNRDPSEAEIAMMVPFVTRHIELARPKLVVLMGNAACQAMLGTKGITRLRGQWAEVAGTPAMPMFHPAYLLRNPERKREAWADLLDIRARLKAKP